MGMEDDTRNFLVLILNTIAAVFIWMMVHVIAGIYYGLAFYESSPGWKNWIYYIIFIATLYYLLRYVRRKWKL